MLRPNRPLGCSPFQQILGAYRQSPLEAPFARLPMSDATTENSMSARSWACRELCAQHRFPRRPRPGFPVSGFLSGRPQRRKGRKPVQQNPTDSGDPDQRSRHEGSDNRGQGSGLAQFDLSLCLGRHPQCDGLLGSSESRCRSDKRVECLLVESAVGAKLKVEIDAPDRGGVSR